MISLASVLEFNAFTVLSIPTGDTQNTRDLGMGVSKTRDPVYFTNRDGDKWFLINITVFCFRLFAPPQRLCHLVSRDLLETTYRRSLFLFETRLKLVAQVDKPNMNEDRIKMNPFSSWTTQHHSGHKRSKWFQICCCFSLSCSVLEVFCILKSLTLTWIVYSCIRVFSFSFLSPCDYVFPTCCVTVISGVRSGYDGSLYCVSYMLHNMSLFLISFPDLLWTKPKTTAEDEIWPNPICITWSPVRNVTEEASAHAQHKFGAVSLRQAYDMT